MLPGGSVSLEFRTIAPEVPLHVQKSEQINV